MVGVGFEGLRDTQDVADASVHACRIVEGKPNRDTAEILEDILQGLSNK